MTAPRYIDCLRQALRDEMAGDGSVVVLGEDVAYGGPFGATSGLAEEFGETRVRNTPISEGTVLGTAVGAAACGLRPVVEVMFIDFITLAMDQLVNHAAKLHYMSGGQLRVPITVRAQGGISGAYGAHHSQSLEAWLAHVPGLKVVAPSTPADAYGLLRAAIRDDNPVVVFEHRALYWRRGAAGDDAGGVLPLGSAAVRRSGCDVTVVTYSRMTEAALQAADSLAARGIDVEVIDARSLVPLDVDTIVESVRKTRRLVVAHEAVERAGFGAEIAATAQEVAFEHLDAPVVRVGSPFAPVPASASLEAVFAPDASALEAAVAHVITAGKPAASTTRG
ncbi:MAG: alpha-ketoacid dehydrogenase subunit beta [Streptosporangiaceae bacterium]